MKSLSIASSVLLALLATAASANQEPTEAEPADTNSQQAEQDLNNEASAHGYQNPTGEDPQPRLTEDTIENAHGDDERVDDEEDSQKR